MSARDGSSGIHFMSSPPFHTLFRIFAPRAPERSRNARDSSARCTDTRGPTDGDGSTALMEAACNGDPQIAAALLKVGVRAACKVPLGWGGVLDANQNRDRVKNSN